MDELDAPRRPDAPAPAPKPAGSAAFIGTLLLITLLGAGGGGAVGLMQAERVAAVATARANAAPVEVESALAWDDGSAVLRLEPVIANLVTPSGVVVRLDTAVVVDRERMEDQEALKAVLAQDVLAYLRTLSASDLQGATAFNHLREDLNERVRYASRGVARELMIETMVIQ